MPSSPAFSLEVFSFSFHIRFVVMTMYAHVSIFCVALRIGVHIWLISFVPLNRSGRGSAPDRTEWSGRWRYICGAPPPPPCGTVFIHPVSPVNIHHTYICWLAVHITQPWYSRLTLAVLSFGAYRIRPGTDRSIRELTRGREKAWLIIF